MGASLSQIQDQNERIGEFYLAILNPAQINYSPIYNEPVSIMKATKNVRQFLIGERCTLKTNHKALTNLFTVKNLNTRLMRWVIECMEHNFEIVYVKCTNNPAGY